MYSKKTIETANAILLQRRQKARQEAAQRQAELYRQHPRLGEYDRQLRGLTRSIALAAISGEAEETEGIMDRIRRVQEERRKLLDSLGLPRDILEPQYQCPLCKDTGTVEGRRCQCMEALLRAESCRGLPSVILDGRSTFDTFDLRYYPEAPDQSGRSPRKTMAAILQRCRDYADHFSTASESLLFLGRTGLGKTHLSLAIAGQTASQGAAVLYSSAQGIIDRYERVRFDRSPTAEDRDFVQMAPRCDLLVIDDLGSEFSTTFSQSVFYNLLNERITAGLPVILSTNLTLEQLNTTYNERIASRVLCGCTSYSFAGKDIRFLKQAERRK